MTVFVSLPMRAFFRCALCRESTVPPGRWPLSTASEFSPRAAMRSPRWWPWDFPGGGRGFSPRGSGQWSTRHQTEPRSACHPACGRDRRSDIGECHHWRSPQTHFVPDDLQRSARCKRLEHDQSGGARRPWFTWRLNRHRGSALANAASIAGLAGNSAWVSVRPPLSARGPRPAFATPT